MNINQFLHHTNILSNYKYKPYALTISFLMRKYTNVEFLYEDLSFIQSLTHDKIDKNKNINAINKEKNSVESTFRLIMNSMSKILCHSTKLDRKTKYNLLPIALYNIELTPYKNRLVSIKSMDSINPLHVHSLVLTNNPNILLFDDKFHKYLLDSNAHPSLTNPYHNFLTKFKSKICSIEIQPSYNPATWLNYSNKDLSNVFPSNHDNIYPKQFQSDPSKFIEICCANLSESLNNAAGAGAELEHYAEFQKWQSSKDNR